MHFISTRFNKIRCNLMYLNFNVDVNLMNVILQHCYFKTPLFHYKTLSVHHSSIGSSESLSDRTFSFKIEFKMSFD